MNKAKYPQICRVKVVVSNARVLALTLIHEPIPRVLQPHNDSVPLSYFLVQYLLSVVCFLELFRDFGWVSRHHSWWWVSFLPFAVFFVLSNDVLFLTFYPVFCILLSWRCLFFYSFLLFLSLPGETLALSPQPVLRCSFQCYVKNTLYWLAVQTLFISDN